MKHYKTMIFFSLILMVSSSFCQQVPKMDQQAAMKDFKRQVEEALPTVVSLTGIQRSESVNINLLTRSELGCFFEKNLKIEYPDEELKKRGQCFAEIGLLPHGYDLENGLLELVKEQAGAIYDPRSKTIIGLNDLPPEQLRDINDQMILAHELTHALQDRVIDIIQHSEIGLRNIDYEYALRAVLEGMASSVMLAYVQNLPYNKLPDLRSF